MTKRLAKILIVKAFVKTGLKKDRLLAFGYKLNEGLKTKKGIEILAKVANNNKKFISVEKLRTSFKVKKMANLRKMLSLLRGCQSQEVSSPTEKEAKNIFASIVNPKELHSDKY